MLQIIWFTDVNKSLSQDFNTEDWGLYAALLTSCLQTQPVPTCVCVCTCNTTLAQTHHTNKYNYSRLSKSKCHVAFSHLNALRSNVSMSFPVSFSLTTLLPHLRSSQRTHTHRTSDISHTLLILGLSYTHKKIYKINNNGLNTQGAARPLWKEVDCKNKS